VNVRPITPDDFPALAAFLAEDETHLFGRPSRVGVADVTAWLSGPDLTSDTWLFEEDGRLVAAGWVEKHHDTGIAIGIVHRERRGRGLGSELVDRSEERLRALGVGRVHAVTLAPDAAAGPLLTGRGYREVRRFWEMTIELGDDPPPEPRLQPFADHGLPREDVAAMHARENAEFVKRGWTVNLDSNSARVPDDLAEKIAAQISAPPAARATTATTQQGVAK